ncbi:hypothetical protein ARAM_007139 [Aspergillus rambellii]|uniref:Protein SQS1 n=1 Tax=Aspergillus rambellii TaxID=308745 RepID=A0A0F8WS89_9EURO|nr:hypothetical protein ARAM_007139 [Aspergillus rambellii]
MARHKAKPRKSSSKNTDTGPKKNHLSMQQEARYTEGHNIWRVNVQLRHQAVHFVSAGGLGPNPGVESETSAQELPESEHPATAELAQHEKFEVDLGVESSPNKPVLNDVTVRPASSTRLSSPFADDSSEDEVVFRGRGPRIESKPSTSATNTDLGDDSDDQPPLYTGLENNITAETSDEDDILADYIANMDDEYEYHDDSSTSSHEHLSADEAIIEPEQAKTLHRGSLSRSRTGSNELKNVFAPSTAFADTLELDPYSGFDIMDFTRPSLGKKSKGKHRTPNFDLLDTEFETELTNAWSNDRLRKKIRKQEREVLRSQGLLGRSKNDPDLKIKYTDRMGIEDLKSEIRLFLLSSKNSLSLPPMTKHRRVLVHDIANALRLNSQSRGKGSSRFPIMTKTSRTPKYTQQTISQTDRIFSKERFSSRAIKAWDKTSGRPTKGHKSVSYVDGEIVGASAPEIGIDNKGRAMLEKMGWSTGTALGATHNKGILQPVVHVVKNSKAGLG